MRYRLWYVPQIGMGRFYEQDFNDLTTAAIALNTIYKVAIWEYENHVKSDFANIGGVRFFDEQEQLWIDVDAEELDYDDDYAEKHNVIKNREEIMDILR